MFFFSFPPLHFSKLITFQKQYSWRSITYFILYINKFQKDIVKISCFKQKTFNFACLSCFSFGVGEFFLKIGEKYIPFWEKNGALFRPQKNHEMRALCLHNNVIRDLTKLLGVMGDIIIIASRWNRQSYWHYLYCSIVYRVYNDVEIITVVWCILDLN